MIQSLPIHWTLPFMKVEQHRIYVANNSKQSAEKRTVQLGEEDHFERIENLVKGYRNKHKKWLTFF